MINSAPSHQPFIRGDAAIALTCALWGLGTVLMKNVIGDTPETLNIFVFNGIRLPIGALLLFSTEKLIGESIQIRRKDLLFLAGLSFIGFLNSICYLYGLNITSASNTGVITATVPLFILIVSFFSGLEKPTVYTILGIIVGFVGALMLGWQGENFTINTGDMTILAACGLMGAFTVYSKRIVSEYTPMVTAGWIFLFTFFYQLPFFIMKLPYQSWVTVPMETWINFAISIVGPLYIANAFYYYSLKTIGAARVGVFTYLIPVFTLFFAYLLRHEAITFQKIVGLTVIIAGIVITRKRVYRQPIY